MELALKAVDKIVAKEVYLKDVNLELQSGSRYVVLGRTLAGKTTLLRIMAGLDRPTTGKVLVDGKDVTGVTVRKRQVAMVYQQFINYPSLNIYKNIASPLINHGVEKSEIEKRVKKVAKLLHIDQMLDRLPAELSGGQQQRTAIARALVSESPLLLLDEPLVNLDYKLREELREELLGIFDKRESIVVYTTTEPTEALMLGGNIIVMHEGRVLQVGPTQHVYENPAFTTVAEVLSDPPINFLTAIVDDGKAKLRIGIDFPLTGHLANLDSGEYTFGVRAHHFFLNRKSENDVEIRSRVELTEINGSQTFVHFWYRNRSLVVQEDGVYGRKTGDEISVFVNPDDFFIYDKSGNLMRAPSRPNICL